MPATAPTISSRSSGRSSGVREVDAGALEQGDGAALASQVGGDGLQHAGPQRRAHDGLLVVHRVLERSGGWTSSTSGGATLSSVSVEVSG